MKTKFDDFVNEQYTLFIDDSTDDFEAQEVNWELEYDVADIWKQYKENKDLNGFIKNYKDRLLGKKDKLVEIGKSCWNDLVKIVNDKSSDNYIDEIYDWADKYGVKINTKNNN